MCTRSCSGRIMGRVLALLTVAGLLGCSSFYFESACGRQRSLAVDDTLSGFTIHIILVDEEGLGDGFTWELFINTSVERVTAVHLHDGSAGGSNRILYDLTTADLNPDPGFTVAGGGEYSHSSDIQNLFDMVRSRRTYIDVHTAANRGSALRADVVPTEFADWSDNHCS